MPRGDDRLRLVDLLQNLREGLLLYLPAGSIKQQPNVNVGSLPDPVFVGEVPVGDDSCALKLIERRIAALGDEIENGP